MWISKDGDNGEIWLYNNKPQMNKSKKYFCGEGIRFPNDSDMLLEALGMPSLTFENSPIEIELVVKNITNVTT